MRIPARSLWQTRLTGRTLSRYCVVGLLVSLLAACSEVNTPVESVPDVYGTTEPFAEQAVYFVVTDRFVDGDPSNNNPEQGGDYGSFDLPITADDGTPANLGYLGGDLAGVLNNGDYIRDMGFTSVWITPIVDNPNAHFTGGYPLGSGRAADRGKAAYHGYWGVNFYKVDEHLESAELTFADFTQEMKQRHDLDIVLDIVCNHGSPSWTMPRDQPMYGEIYDGAGRLVADHQNLPPEELDESNPLHSFFHKERDLAELSNLDDTNPAVLEYMVGAYLQWIEQGAAAFRIDTIRHMPHAFWKKFSDRIRAHYPGFFMFGEHFDYDASKIAEHMLQENGSISVLDFPGRRQMIRVFEDSNSDFADLLTYLHLDDGVYRNPYNLMTFYDNHDVTRMNAGEEGFIDANNWLFTSRGIPVVYYGSEIAFMAGKGEHEGNRNFFGQDRVTQAKQHRVHSALRTIARVRRQSPALQRGLQVNLEFSGDRAAFYRVYQRDSVAQSALVLLNKGDAPADFTIARWLSTGEWVDAVSSTSFNVTDEGGPIETSVPGHGVQVLLYNARVKHPAFKRKLKKLMDSS